MSENMSNTLDVNKKAVKIKIGDRIVELLNNDKEISELDEKYASIINTLSNEILELKAQVENLTKIINGIDDEPSGNDENSQGSTGDSH